MADDLLDFRHDFVLTPDSPILVDVPSWWLFGATTPLLLTRVRCVKCEEVRVFGLMTMNPHARQDGWGCFIGDHRTLYVAYRDLFEALKAQRTNGVCRVGWVR